MNKQPPVPSLSWSYQLPRGKYEGMTLPAEFYAVVSRPSEADKRAAAALRERHERETGKR